MRWWFHSSRLRVMMLAFALSVSAPPWLAHAVPGEAAEGQQRAKLAAIAMSGKTDERALTAFLRDRDPVVAGAAFDALRENDSAAASRALLAIVEDTTEPTRLRALQLLVSGGDVNDANVLSALRTALNDPDSALVAHAVQTLTGRDDPAADSLLTDAMREGSVATRLSIVRSVGTGDAAQRYLYDGLHDSDETVRGAARAVLFPDRDGSDIR